MDSIKNTITTAFTNAVNGATKRLLGQKLIKQYTNPAPKNKYACFFTAWLMYFRHVYGMKMDFMEYRDACLKAGAINDSFELLNHDKMCVAAGHPELKVKSTAAGIREKLLELLMVGQPVPFSLNGSHYESIDGFEVVGGKLRFCVDDPGWQNDEYATGDTLEVYREENGAQKFSVHDGKAGKKRKITRVYWAEKA